MLYKHANHIFVYLNRIVCVLQLLFERLVFQCQVPQLMPVLSLYQRVHRLVAFHVVLVDVEVHPWLRLLFFFLRPCNLLLCLRVLWLPIFL